MEFLPMQLIFDGILKDPIDFASDSLASHLFWMGFLRIPLMLHRILKDSIDVAPGS